MRKYILFDYLHLIKTAKSDYLFFEDFIMGNYIENILCQLLKIGRFHSESRHFGHPHSKGAGGRKTLIFKAGLIVANNKVLLFYFPE